MSTSREHPPRSRRRGTTARMSLRRPGGRLLGRLLLPLVVTVLALSGCSGGGGDERTPADVLAAAKKDLDGTSGVHLALTAQKLPPGVDGILEATGAGTHAPAFDGNLKVRVNELTVDVPVVAVGGKVYAKLPFTTKFSLIEPRDYGAPDPAGLLDPANGISTWLTEADGVSRGKQVRDGKRVLTSYAGTLPGEAVKRVIPSADAAADFDVTFEVDDEDRLGSVQVSGPFYGKSGDVDYTVTLTDYGATPDITRP